MRALERASAGVDRACLLIAKTALVGIAVVILLQIAVRYGLRSPFPWTEELARYLMVWGGLMGATCAFRRGLDPVIVPLGASAGRGRHLLWRVMLAATVALFLLPMLYYSFFGAGWNLERGFLWRSMGRTSPGLGVNMALIGAAIPVACLVILLHTAARIALRDPGHLASRGPEQNAG
jgi:TRAP-type C4-dicarboxylate transport system permease small subunit